MWRALQRGAVDDAFAAYASVTPFLHVSLGAPDFVAVIKTVLHHRGVIASPAMRLPLIDPTPRRRAEIVASLDAAERRLGAPTRRSARSDPARPPSPGARASPATAPSASPRAIASATRRCWLTISRRAVVAGIREGPVQGQHLVAVAQDRAQHAVPRRARDREVELQVEVEQPAQRTDVARVRHQLDDADDGLALLVARALGAPGGGLRLEDLAHLVQLLHEVAGQALVAEPLLHQPAEDVPLVRRAGRRSACRAGSARARRPPSAAWSRG